MGMSATHPGGTTPTSDWTADALWAYYERQTTYWPRYELIDGQLLVTSSPGVPHHLVHQAILERVWPHLRAHPVGRMFWSPADLRTAFGTVVQPDLFVVPWPMVPPLREWTDVKRVLLTVEIISPSTARRDRFTKRRYYARMNVPEYWIFDPTTRLVERSFPDGRVEVLSDELVWHPGGASEPLVLDLRAIFAEALGEDDAPPDPADA